MGSNRDSTMGLTHTLAVVTLFLILHRVTSEPIGDYEDYDDYDPNDIPPSQAKPVTKGYSYPVPNNPLELPERARTGKLVFEESSKNLLIIGLKHNEFDSYDPGEYDHNSPDYIDDHPNEIAQENKAKSFRTSFDKVKKPKAFKSNRPRPFTKIRTEIKSGTLRQPKSIDQVSRSRVPHKNHAVQEWLRRGK